MSDIDVDHTRVELTWLEKRIENWIRFGKTASEKILDRRRRIVSFAPGSIFAFVRWASNDFGTVISRIDIVRAVARASVLDRAICAARRRHPVAARRLAEGRTRASRDGCCRGAGIDPADAAPDYWRHVHNRLTAGEAPRPTRVAPPGMAAPTEDRRMNGRVAILADDAGGRSRLSCFDDRDETRPQGSSGTRPKASHRSLLATPAAKFCH